MPLSDLQIKNAPNRDRAYKLFDGDGLHLLIQPSGSKLWRMRYILNGRERMLSFGPYPVVGLAAARKKRDSAREQLRIGVDPMAEPPKAVGHTFEDIARAWHGNRADRLDDAHAVRVLSRMERDAFPLLGSRVITTIQPVEVVEDVRQVEARGSLDVARRLKQDISKVFRYAIGNGWATMDPAANINEVLRPRPKVQHMARIPLPEMARFLGLLDRYDGEELTRLALEFTLLTWARTTEIREAEWSEFKGDQWSVPQERMKMGRPHVVPLSQQAQKVFRRLQVIRRSDRFVFPHDRKPVKPMSQNAMLFALYRMGYRSKLTVHGFRGLASTWANEQFVNGVRRYDSDWIEAALAHVEGGVRGAYNAAEYLPQRATMLQDWADYLDQQRVIGELLG